MRYTISYDINGVRQSVAKVSYAQAVAAIQGAVAVNATNLAVVSSQGQDVTYEMTQAAVVL
ncbi:MAG: hypothetical protein AAGJ95_13925 [Cyanobacteria bacterium J06554_11]